MESKNCLICGSFFVKKQTTSRKVWWNSKYCSLKCMHIGCDFKKWQVAPNKWKIYTEEQKKWMKLFEKWHTKVGTEHLKKWREKGWTPWNKWIYWYELHGGSKQPLKDAIRSCQKNINWRTNILKRDNYTCQECWRKRKPWDRVILEVDHIIPFSQILIDYKIETLESAYSTEILWDESNWKTLCKECHKKTESHWSNQWKR